MEGLRAHVGDVGTALAADAEFGIYQRPRFVGELAAIPFERDGILVYGGPEPELLRGGSGRAILATLLPLLDGTRTLEELADRVPRLTLQQVSSVVALLQSRGMLEEGGDGPADEATAHLGAFLGRFNHVTRLNRNRHEALDRLRQARVAVMASPAAATVLCRQLDAAGIGHVASGPDWAADLTLVAPAGEEEEERLAAEMTAGARRHGHPLLWLRVGEESVRLGPLYLPDLSPCPACVGRAHPIAGSAEDPLWCSLAALTAFLYLSRLGGPRMFGYNSYQVQEREAHTPARRFYLARRPGCPECGLEPQGSPWETRRGAGLAWAYQASVSFPPSSLVSRSEYQGHYSPLNRQLTGSREPTLPVLLRVPLPRIAPPEDPDIVPLPKETSVTVETLGYLLGEAAGMNPVRGDGSWRLPPTSGGLGSVELYVLTRGSGALRGGLYGYHTPDHTLLLHREDVPTFMGTPLDPARCVIIGVGALGRLQDKYGLLAYRLAYLDAGVALAYLHEVAAECGMSIEELPAADPDIEAAIGLPPRAGRFVPLFSISISPARGSVQEIPE